MKRRRPRLHQHVPLLAIIILFSIHVGGIALFDVYELWPTFDIFTHFLGGFAVGLLGIHVYDRIAESHGISSWYWWQELLFVIGFVMLVAVAWEFHEYILDYVSTRWILLSKSQLSLSDTMGDLLMGLLGAISAHFFRKPIAKFGYYLFVKK